MKKVALVMCLLTAVMVFAMTACNQEKGGGGETKNITLTVYHGDDTEKTFEITTEKSNLQEALLDEKLVEGSESSTGLFVTTVDGETADDSNQEWWLLTKDGEDWLYGVKDTKLADGDKYEFTLTVGY